MALIRSALTKQNIGDGFANTIGIFFQVINRYVSSESPRWPVLQNLFDVILAVADAIALGAIFAVENWYANSYSTSRMMSQLSVEFQRGS